MLVLQTYWELEARIGTKMKLVFSTFELRNNFGVFCTFYFPKSKITIRASLKTRPRPSLKHRILIEHFHVWCKIKKYPVDRFFIPSSLFFVCTKSPRSRNLETFWPLQILHSQNKNMSSKNLQWKRLPGAVSGAAPKCLGVGSPIELKISELRA